MKLNYHCLMRGAKPKEMPPDKGERGPPRQPGCLGRGRAKRAMYLRSIEFGFFFIVDIFIFIIIFNWWFICGVNLGGLYTPRLILSARQSPLSHQALYIFKTYIRLVFFYFI